MAVSIIAIFSASDLLTTIVSNVNLFTGVPWNSAEGDLKP
jgi:hypothetical protein